MPLPPGPARERSRAQSLDQTHLWQWTQARDLASDGGQISYWENRRILRIYRGKLEYWLGLFVDFVLFVVVFLFIILFHWESMGWVDTKNRWADSHSFPSTTLQLHYTIIFSEHWQLPGRRWLLPDLRWSGTAVPRESDQSQRDNWWDHSRPKRTLHHLSAWLAVSYSISSQSVTYMASQLLSVSQWDSQSLT